MDVRTIPFTLNRAARWHPDREAFVQGFAGEERRYSYSEANDEARRIAQGLASLGVEKGDRVALLNDSNVEHALAHYACTKLGAVPAGLHTREAPNPLAAMVERIGADTLLFHPEYASKVERIREQLDADIELVAFDTLGETPAFARPLSELTADAEAVEPDVTVSETDMAYINFSSGSTGLPKPLVTRHGQITEMLHIEAGGTTEEGRILNAFGTGFMGWENVTLTNVAVGATTVFHSGPIERVAELIERETLTRVSLITTPWRILLRSGNLDECDMSSVASAGVSGEPITAELHQELTETLTASVGTGYGLTETMGSGTSLPSRFIDEETIQSVGKPGLSCDVRVIEPGSRDPEATVPDGDTGEVIINGPSVCSEVYGDPELSEELFHEDGWVFTGDRGAIEAGFLYLKGRSDNMIISGGINVYAERVERVLESHPAVAEVAIVGTPHEKWGEAVKAYVIPAAAGTTAEDLDGWCRESDDLADYQRPREYEFVEELPRNNPGKLDRAALRERERE
ncbi:MAG: class I adenylate-forming enzyme family protein [Halolamina sp.]